MIRPVEARISLRALQANLSSVQRLAPQSKIMSIIKANGYGHGMIRVARALKATDAFGVASFEEALTLREAAIARPIMLLSGFLEAAELPTISRHQLWITVHHPFQVDILERTPLAEPINVWLKIDTGMHRLGVRPDAMRGMWSRLNALPWIAKPIGFMTHFACADEREHPLTAAQQARFDSAVGNMPGVRSMANSAAIFTLEDCLRDWVRPGIALYGASPFADRIGTDLGLQPVMTLTSRVIAVNEVRRGETIGYGASWTCPEDMRIGIVAVGYGDGYPRHARPGTPVLINGVRVPLIGRISMDSLFVDLRQHHQVAIGDRAVLWGDDLPVEEVAAHAGTIPYELLCKVTGRVKFNEQW